MLGSILTSGYQHGIDPHLGALPPDAAERARGSLAFVVQAADRLGPRGPELVDVAKQSFTDGMQTAMWVGAAVLIVGSAATLLRRDRDAR